MKKIAIKFKAKEIKEILDAIEVASNEGWDVSPLVQLRLINAYKKLTGDKNASDLGGRR